MDTKEFARILHAHTMRAHTGEPLSGSEIAHQLQRIITFEVEEGGPYAVPESGVKDIGLNIAIANFLAIHGVHLPKLDDFLHTILRETGAYTSEFFAEDELSELITTYTQRVETGESALPKAVSSVEADMLECIRAEAENRFAHLPVEMQERANELFEWTLNWNKDHQIALMPFYVRAVLGEHERFSDDLIAQMGLANVFFWTAFIVYDDFWDEDENADPKLLPIANLFARHYIDFFSTLLPDHPEFRRFFHEHMDCLDAANAWETTDCRARVAGNRVCVPEHIPAYGDYAIKFYPAIGQIMAPIALLLLSGIELHDAAIVSLIDYFKHSLISRQINDDLHDWKEDLVRGHISTVVAKLLEAWRERYPEREEIDLDTDMSSLEQLYWYEVIDPLCTSILDHAEQARSALHAISVFVEVDVLEQFIVRNERVAREALAERALSEDFVSAFAK